jgi:hypothetical protein
MNKRDRIANEQIEPLTTAFRSQLIALLEKCAAGRWGLFVHLDQIQPEVARYLRWPEAEQLRELAFALQSILAQSGESDPLVEQFLDLCSMHGESNPGEPKLARAFLDHIAAEQL